MKQGRAGKKCHHFINGLRIRGFAGTFAVLELQKGYTILDSCCSKKQKKNPAANFEALPGVQSVRARAENDAQNVLLPFYFINFVRILPFAGRKMAFLLGRPAFGLRF